MPEAHTLAIREKIIDLRKSGESLLHISHILSISYGRVRNIYKKYQLLGAVGLVPNYKNCIKQPVYGKSVRQECLKQKELHPRWGVPRLRVLLLEKYGSETPSLKTLQRWCQQAGLGRPNQRHGERKFGKSQAVHNIWQVDAKENLVLGTGFEACYLTITDEKSGAWLASPVFPL